MPGLAVSFGPDHSTWQHHVREPFEQVADSKGTFQISQHLVGTRLRVPEPRSRTILAGAHPRRPMMGKQSTICRRPNTDAGHNHGLPCGGRTDGPCRAIDSVQRRLSPELDRFDRWYADYFVTGPTGRFRIDRSEAALRTTSASPRRDGYHAVAPAQRVTLASGQTVEVSLRANDTDQTPYAH